ncbi:MAG: Tetratricopeptide repeat [Candidatus Sumerlaeota bacterium]|nr:Tetratricopeptide repeat [Candidatus Sumerlaeota bacterium]
MTDRAECAAPPHSSLAGELCRIAPVWGIVAGIVVASLLLIRFNGVHYLESGVLAEADACTVAEVRFHAGRKIWRQLADELAVSREGATRMDSTLGSLADNERLGEATAILEESARLCPSLAGVHEYLADLAWWSGDEAMAHYHLAREHRVRGELEFARIELAAARELAPEDTSVLRALLDLAVERKDWQGAEALLATAPPEVADSAVSWWARGNLALSQGHGSEALDLIKKALEMEPGRQEWIGTAFDLFWQQERFVEGGDWIVENVNAAQAREAGGFHRASGLYYQAGEWQKALDALETALAIQPNNIMMLMERALLESRLGRIQAAKSTAELAFNKNPGEYRRLLEESRFEEIRQLRPQ